MVRIAIQLYTLRDLDIPPWEVVARVGDTAFDGVELYDGHFEAFADDETLRRTREALDAAELDVAGAHVSVGRLESETDTVIEICDALDCSRLVVPSYDGDAFSSRDGVENAADHISSLAAGVESDGFELLYHNHGFEFGDIEGDVAFELFVDQADGQLGYEPDVGLARHVDYDPLDLLEIVSGRAPLVHLTDTVPGDSDRLHADLGEGAIDGEACARTAVENGAEWLICENGPTDDAVASLERGSEAFADLRRRTTGGSAAR